MVHSNFCPINFQWPLPTTTFFCLPFLLLPLSLPSSPPPPLPPFLSPTPLSLPRFLSSSPSPFLHVLLCLHRSGYFAYEKDESLYGIGLYRFNLPAVELLNTSQDPGFYPNGPSGVLNLTSVFPENAPVFASKPHFLDAFAGYRANVSGMDPDRSLHDSHLDVEPITGEGGTEGRREGEGEGGREGRREKRREREGGRTRLTYTPLSPLQELC